MRTSGVLPLVLAAAGTQVAAQTSVSVGAPSASIVPAGPATGKLGNATVTTKNPQGVVYQATFPDTPFFKGAYPDGGNIKGTLTAVANPSGQGIIFTFNWKNLPKKGGPFMYHLHVDPVPENGNCTATLAHLDPFIRFEDPVCDKAHPETCQTGDLSGKFGDIPEGQTEFSATFPDLYSSTEEGLGSFFGNRSIVFHYANKTRVSCANFVKVAGDSHGGHGASESPCSTATGPHATGHANLTTTTSRPASGTSTPAPTTTPSGPALSIGSSLQASAAGVIAFGAALMFLL
ncbi:hypothetical protein B0T14DRAFT_31381 [Immersiella caudata]|uniref:superoxide dismutase n=1 Tax=Immersiella caudata TaxID=314043 RepID=A0AA39XED6_9PEZI|nr:hypothetical protein B0T14DRAFT_31381 [Immersiella caudata]